MPKFAADLLIPWIATKRGRLVKDPSRFLEKFCQFLDTSSSERLKDCGSHMLHLLSSLLTVFGEKLAAHLVRRAVRMVGFRVRNFLQNIRNIFLGWF